MGTGTQTSKLLTPKELEFFELRYDRKTCRPKMTLEKVAEAMDISLTRSVVYQRKIKEKLHL
jgi:hypothetical protein